jgi:hypothetical protein
MSLCRVSWHQCFGVKIETFETFGFLKWSWLVEARGAAYKHWAKPLKYSRRTGHEGLDWQESSSHLCDCPFRSVRLWRTCDGSSRPVACRAIGTDSAIRNCSLVLQGGGALGAYQAGVYEALSEAGIYPNWIAGVSVGAINAAIIAGNAPDARVDRLHEFWTLDRGLERVMPVSTWREATPCANSSTR